MEIRTHKYGKGLDLGGGLRYAFFIMGIRANFDDCQYFHYE
jgi:hypothetical protein